MEIYTCVKVGNYDGDVASLLSNYPSKFTKAIPVQKPHIILYVTAKLVENVPVTILIGQNLLGFDPDILYNILIGVQGPNKEKNKIVMQDLESKLRLKLEDLPANSPVSFSGLQI